MTAEERTCRGHHHRDPERGPRTQHRGQRGGRDRHQARQRRHHVGRGPDGHLPEEHAMSTRTHATPARRRIARTRDTLGRAALLTASIALAAGCTDSGAPGPSGTTPEPSGTATTGEPLWVTAYFMVDT